jgi:Holliday junction resolvase RusA-like endonuclease
VIQIQLRCPPPSVTAQQKRLRVVGGKPVFFHGQRMQREAATWAALLQPYRPAAPLSGPLFVVVKLVWPHRTTTAQKDRHRWIPKTTKPDASNVTKHLEDVLVQLGFIGDDALVSSLTVEKWWGPDEAVGIYLWMAPMVAGETGSAAWPR